MTRLPNNGGVARRKGICKGCCARCAAWTLQRIDLMGRGLETATELFIRCSKRFTLSSAMDSRGSVHRQWGVLLLSALADAGLWGWCPPTYE